MTPFGRVEYHEGPKDGDTWPVYVAERVTFSTDDPTVVHVYYEIPRTPDGPRRFLYMGLAPSESATQLSPSPPGREPT